MSSTYNQQQSYPNSGVNQSTMESEAHRQYMASMRRRAPPPRFRPPMIIFMVLMGGLVFIGLVMTIIAVWPGYTPVGGNPLKIAGPILLALGGIGFIIGIILICRKSQDEKKQFARSFYAASSQRSLARSQTNATPTPSMDAKPGKGILKNPSSSSYNGTVHEGSDSGMPATHSFSTNRSYEGSEGSDSITGQGHVVGRVPPVSLNPDPTAAYRGHQKYPGGPVDHSSSTESEQAVMAHMTQMSRAPQKHSSSYQNQAYAKETDIDGDIEGPRSTSTGKREMQQYGNNSFDAYDASAHLKQQQLQQKKELQLPKQNPRWGQNRDRPPITPPAQKRGTTPPPLRSSGVFNDAYEVDTQISTVSQEYTQYTTPQRQVVETRQTYQYSPATASPAADINTSSVSTEV